MSDPFLGEIRMFGGNFAPRNWEFCHGQILSIQQNTALFSLLGVNYGGNGTTTFALPDLRGRVPIHVSSGDNIVSARTLGEQGGTETVTLRVSELPVHTHGLSASNNATSPAYSGANGTLGNGGGNKLYGLAGSPASMRADAIGATGGGAAHENMAPALCVSFIIATSGIFPSRP